MQLLDNRVLVQPAEVEEKSKGGIHFAKTAITQPKKGKVISVGPGRHAFDGSLVPMTVKVGDTVIFPVNVGAEVLSEDGEKLLMFREGDLLATI